MLSEIQKRLLDAVVDNPPNIKKFRVQHEAHRDEIKKLAAMQLFVEKDGSYFATFGGIILSTTDKARLIQNHFRALYESLRARYRQDPERKITTAEISAELGITKTQANYLFKLNRDHTGPSLLGGGNYSDGEGDSNIDIAEEILDLRSFDDIVVRVREIVDERAGHFPARSLKDAIAGLAGSALQRPADAPRPPKVPEKWRWGARINEGGQGVTYHVRDAQGRQFVGKRLKNLKRLDRFKDELKALSKLDHPNIVKVIDSDLADERPFIIMEYCAGRDLDSNRFWMGSPSIKFQLMRQILIGVIAAHDEKIIHRDLKPANILLREAGGSPVIADFGICFIGGEIDAERKTETLDVMGPRGFLAPEYEAGFVDSPEPQGDIYSLGKLFYWLMSDGVMLQRELFREKKFNLCEKFKDSRYEHINLLLDQTVVHDPAKRARTTTEMLEGLELIEKQFESRSNFPESNFDQRCIYCGVGKYRAAVTTPAHAANFGFVNVGDPKWRILICERCGNTQIFRKDLI